VDAEEGNPKLIVSASNAQIQQASLKGMQMRERRLAEYRKRFPLEERLKQHIVGQDHAVKVVSAAIRRKQNGWHSDDSPLVMLFLGSSGIGKTETAKRVSEFLHGAGKTDGFIRVDMTEYQSEHEVSKFIGAPPGYIGYEQGGQLTKKLKKNPKAVVLLDEVEKAHPNVLTVMLQAFDEGRLTDGQGNTVDCKEATFIMTSNLGQREIADEAMRLRAAGSKLSTSTETTTKTTELDIFTKSFKNHVMLPILYGHFGRDEFLGRINEIVYFLPFTSEEQIMLAEKEMKLWAQRALSRNDMKLSWDKDVLNKLVEDGYNVRFGARSLKFEVDRQCISLIAKAHEDGKVGPGCSVHFYLQDQGGKEGESRGGREMAGEPRTTRDAVVRIRVDGSSSKKGSFWGLL